ncbi:pilus biogenesis lipoprotein CpaD [Nitratireductor aestuarii]|uniref:Pilus biogenesis lipoprotein CpaD n=1 Tax=Nitratireductor aestuarii TaxID=1735103 RepID=A0A916RJ25_9HYPH|nr:CpaD family pilus assembly lipoprotein [Nitratireductor aestuarii]GGA57741.1 pilus biogenesis lipoprotein CpaD [Nitratireductor aestuarii]
MQISRFGKCALSALVMVAAPLVTGCAQQDQMVVNAVPDDYRTRHPIIISEKDQVLDLPVGLTSFSMTPMHRTALDGFFSNYRDSGNAVVTIMVPQGSGNAGAARSTASEFAKFIRARGVSSGRLQTVHYDANGAESAPIRISYPVMKAHTGQCGQWPEDLGNTYENRQYSNFGCSYQNNLAAQIANPSDLLTPRRMTPSDMANRGAAIGAYQRRGISGEFNSRSEVSY